jgi:subtilase family serine protease
MSRFAAALSFSLLAGSLLVPAYAQEHGRGDIEVPDSSLEGPNDRGLRAHTNHRILSDKGSSGTTTPTTPAGFSPAQIRSAYNLNYNRVDSNKNPLPNGKGIIAIIDAYDYPFALRDFNIFAKQFGLPQETSTDVTASSNTVFQVKYQGARPRSNTSWNQEAALDIEWAHALAPDAKIVLIEAQNTSFTNMFAAVDIAVTLGASQISMSWSSGEFLGETDYDVHFNVPGPIFFAASGDSGAGAGYPAASPYVVGCGGTHLVNSGGIYSESGWSGAGGGPSTQESKPGWQSAVPDPGTFRCIPDLAAVADPNTGVAVYAPWSGSTSKWMVFGGTSVATPCLAAMVNLGGATYTVTTTPDGTNSTTVTFLTAVYTNLTPAGLLDPTVSPPNFRDVIGGSNGHPCVAGWDFVTGIGSPQGTGF